MIEYAGDLKSEYQVIEFEKSIYGLSIKESAWSIEQRENIDSFRMCTGTFEEIEQKLPNYKNTHNGKEFMCDVSTKTIEDICQLLQCQPHEIKKWKIDLALELFHKKQ